MQHSVHQYFPGKGWDSPFPVAWDGPQTLVLVFGAPEWGQLESSPIEEVAEIFPHSCRVGCSTAGEIRGPERFESTLLVAIWKLDRGLLQAAWLGALGEEPGRVLGKALKLPGKSPGAVLFFLEGSSSDTQSVEATLGGLWAELGEVLIVGGIPGAGRAPAWVLGPGPALGAKGVAVALYGVQGVSSTGTGWDVFGPERVITDSDGAILFSLDERPALELYREYLGEKATGLPGAALRFPLSIRASRQDANPLIRTVLGINEETHSLLFGGTVPMGKLARLMRPNADRLVDGAASATLMVRAALEGVPEGVGSVVGLMVSCVGRNKVLGERAEEELEVACDLLPTGMLSSGFYAFGQLAPNHAGVPSLHNQTFALTALWEVPLEQG